MRMAITGASGHVGVNLVRRLCAAGHRPRVLIHRDERALAGLDVEPVRASVLDPGSLLAAFEGIDLVFHLAARISIDPREDEEVLRINVEGTRHVVAACLERRVRRLVHTSSIHALSAEPHDRPVDETRPLAHGSPHAYDRSKARAEELVAEAGARGLEVVVVNPTGIIGPYDARPSMMGQVLLDLYRGRLPALVLGGFNWVDVRDVAAGLVAAAERGRPGERYLLPGTYASVGALADLIHQLGGERPPRLAVPVSLALAAVPAAALAARLLETRPLFTRASLDALRSHQDVRGDKARSELGHAPRPLVETVRDTLAWFQEAGLLD